MTPAGNGIFYGTTFAGGVSNWGTIFLITTNGAFTNLFSFTGTNNPWQGATPRRRVGAGRCRQLLWHRKLWRNLTNALYLNSSYLLGYGYGTVFQLASNGTVTASAVFGGTNGAYPSGGLVLANDGNFYGTTTGAVKASTGDFRASARFSR